MIPICLGTQHKAIHYFTMFICFTVILTVLYHLEGIAWLSTFRFYDSALTFVKTRWNYFHFAQWLSDLHSFISWRVLGKWVHTRICSMCQITFGLLAAGLDVSIDSFSFVGLVFVCLVDVNCNSISWQTRLGAQQLWPLVLGIVAGYKVIWLGLHYVIYFVNYNWLTNSVNLL